MFLEGIKNNTYILKEDRLYKKGKKTGTLRANGYIAVSIKSRPVYLHQVLFAYYFGIDELNKYESINHKDGNKHNNYPDNLEGMSLAENSKHQHETGLVPVGSEWAHSILNEDKVRQIKKLLKNKVQQDRIADYYGVSRSAILAIVLNTSWKHVEYDDGIEIPKISSEKERRSDALLSNLQVKEIKKLLNLNYNQNRIAEHYNVSRSLVLGIHLKDKYKDVDYDENIEIPCIVNFRTRRKDSKLSIDQMIKISELFNKGNITKVELGKMFNVSKTVIKKAINRIKEKEVGNGEEK
jgi:predicted DNA-binding protein YlxM (UPF0122 family)